MADRGPGSEAPPSSLSKWAPALVALFILGYFAALGFYFYGIGPERYSSVEATRPILVFTLIVAMLGFGGLLIFRSLFGNTDDFKERFTKAREIFLVFSGIFGTIIGFYFGAADGDARPSPSLASPTFAQGRVVVSVEGGRAPFVGLLARDGQSEVSATQSGSGSLSFTVPGACPAGATITVIDADGARDEAQLSCPAAAQ